MSKEEKKELMLIIYVEKKRKQICSLKEKEIKNYCKER